MLILENVGNKATIPPFENKHGGHLVGNLKLTHRYFKLPTLHARFTSPGCAIPDWLSHLSVPVSSPEDGLDEG